MSKSILVKGRCRRCGQLVELELQDIVGAGPIADIGVPCPHDPTHGLVVDVVEVDGGSEPAAEPLQLEHSPLPGVQVGDPVIVQIPPASEGVAKFALTLGLDPAQIRPTGENGELTFADLETAYLAAQEAAQHGG